MTNSIISGTYYGSTIEQYLLFFAVLLSVTIGAKILYFFIKKYGSLITSKTENEFDDMLIEVLEKPFLFAGFVAGLGIGYQFLNVNLPFIENNFFSALAALIIIDFTWLALRLVDGIVEHFLIPLTQKTDSRLDDQLIPILRKVAKFSIVVLAGIIILSSFGIDVLPLIAGLGIGGLAVAFAAQKTVEDMFGGLSIFVSKPFLVGDAVKVKGVEGIVDAIGLRYTKIKDWDGRINTIPNSQVAQDVMLNITSEGKKRVSVTLGLTYDTPYKKMQEAMQLLKDIVLAHPDTDHENIRAVFKEYADSSLNIWFVYYINDRSRMFDIMSEINMEIKKRFEKAKLDFAYPSQSLYIEKIPKLK